MQQAANKPPQIVDLFCGVGGFSLGAHRAGFRSVLGIDVDPKLSKPFVENFPRSKVFPADISKIGAAEILRYGGLEFGEVTGIIGGPPCQGFSLIGKRDQRDPRNKLIWHFFRIARELKPRFFVMENVPGLLVGEARSTLDEALAVPSDFDIVGPVLVDAWDFGAATRRERVVVVGYDRRFVEALNEENISGVKQRARASVRDAISDLPVPANRDWLPYKIRDESEVPRYARRARMKPASDLGSEVSRLRLEKKEVSGVRKTWHTKEVTKRFHTVAQGGTEKISRCPRLAWDKPAPTLRAGTGPDKGSYQSIRPIHPSSDRVITVREAARLQGFPDWFQFDSTKWHSFRMIGNSVSPVMAEAILRLMYDRTST